MSIEIKKLYNDIYQKYGAEILTKSLYGKEARWAHDLEFIDYVIYLHGEELVFNVSLNNFSEAERKRAIDKLISRRAAGLLMSTEDGKKPGEDLIAYCDSKHFPLLWVNYNAPFIDMLHESFDALVYEDRNSKTREDAFKKAVMHSEDSNQYLSLMETDVFFSNGKYTVLIAGYEDGGREAVAELSELFRCQITRNVTFPEGNTVVALLIGYTLPEIRSELQLMSEEKTKLRIAIGSTVEEARDIRSSYDKAKMAFCMMSALRQRVLAYSNLGIYKMLYEMKDSSVADEFVEETLGKLVRYDREHKTDYMAVLESFMNNECLVSQTADAMFFHRNTIKYKLAAIRDVLGYDVTLNENRFKIMMAFYLVRCQR
ncbi:MAG: helix-turn-helix domain-containing protein [Clostridiales bacterium]|nr:helix-turn-helix domain-containing protein [Candidatus Crickella equi]